MEEIWRDIEGYESKYQVSCFGKVRSMGFLLNAPKGGTWYKEGRELKQSKSNIGYNRVLLFKEGKMTNFLVHRLVAFAFCGLNKNQQVDHIDGDKSNNNYHNLRPCTSRQNNTYYHLSKNPLRKTGTYFRKENKSKPWEAYIQIDGKRKRIGYFSTKEEASFAYQNKLKEITQ
jgi:hypothetical protein